MKAKELMIGDYVKISHRNKIGKVYRIDMANGKGNGFAAVVDSDYHEYDLEPIPLTQEILEKNGFEVTRNMSSSGNKDVWSLRVSKNKVFHIIEHHNKRKFPYFWIELGSNSDIKYVHQLQHALRLCGIEKTIEL